MNGRSLPEIQARLERFRGERDWEQFHSPANLAAAISVEAAELLELFIWSSPASADDILERKRASVESELAPLNHFPGWLLLGGH